MRRLARNAFCAALLCAGASFGQPPSPRVVDLKTPDGVVLKATYFAAAQPGPGVLLLHQVNRDRQSWDSVARQLAAAGVHTLTFDLRGFGESGGTPEDKLTARERAELRDRRPADIDAAIEYLTSQPGVRRDTIGFGGAGYLGVNSAIEAAGRHPAEIKSVALLSGQTLLVGRHFVRQASQLPGLFVVSDADEYPPTEEVMEWLYGLSGNPGKRFIHYRAEKAPWTGYEEFKGIPATGNHGTDLFQTHPDLPGLIVDWFVTTLIKTPGHAPVDKNSAACTLPIAMLDEIETPGGPGRVAQKLAEARRNNPKLQWWPWVVLNVMGFDHLQAGDTKAALEILKLNVAAYPESADANDSLSDAYLAGGQKEPARRYAEKALALLDSDADLSQARRKLVRDSAQQKLKQLSEPAQVPSHAEEILEWWKHIGNKLVAMARDFPEDKYDFKLQQDERSFAQNLLHVAGADYDVIRRVSGSNVGPDLGKDLHNPSRQMFKTKADVVKLLEQAIADGAALIRQQGDAGLEKSMQFGWETGRHVVHTAYAWNTIIEHSAEHFGQLVVYYRANNLVPPESRR